jgi:hypothetical protein
MIDGTPGQLEAIARFKAETAAAFKRTCELGRKAGEVGLTDAEYDERMDLNEFTGMAVARLFLEISTMAETRAMAKTTKPIEPAVAEPPT